jgi:hypothetical protein
MTSSPELQDDFHMAMAVLGYLQEAKLVSAAAALKDELQLKFGKKKLSGHVSKGIIKLVPGTQKKATVADDSSSSDDSSSESEKDTKAKKKTSEVSKDDDSSGSDSSDSDSSSPDVKAAPAASKKASSSDDSSSSDDDSDDDEAKKKAVITKKKAADSSDSDSSSSSESEDEKKTAPAISSKKTKTAKDKVSSSSSAPTKAAAKDDSSSGSDSSDDSDDDKEASRPTKKMRTDATAGPGIITPEVEGSDDDSEVSDVEVSDVSSVDVSSSDDSDDDSSSSESEDEEDAKERLRKKKADAALKAKEAAKAASEWRPSKKSPAKTILQTTPGSDGAQASNKGIPFQRVDSDFWGEEAQKSGGAMADNSYEGAFGGDGFGLKASEKLLTVRGKDFRHEKTKRKRSFNGFARGGGQINVEKTFSTKYTYSDDEK